MAEQEFDLADFKANIKAGDFKPGGTFDETQDVSETGDTETGEAGEENDTTEQAGEQGAGETSETGAEGEVGVGDNTGEGETEGTQAGETETTATKQPAAEQKVPDWKEQIKSAPWEDVLREAGLDEFEIDLLKYRKEKGDITPYLEAKAVDYTKVGDEEILKRDLRKQYSDLDEDDFQFLFEEEMASKYKLDPDTYDERQVKLSQIKMKQDANRVRQSFIEEQKKFTIPNREVVDTARAEQERAQQQAEETQRVWAENVKADAATKDLLQSKKIGLADSKISYRVDNPNEAIEAALEPNKFWSLFSENGKVNLSKFYKVYNYAKNMDKIEKTIYSAGEGTGRKKEVEEIKNPSRIGGSGTSSQTFNNEMDEIKAAFKKAL